MKFLILTLTLTISAQAYSQSVDLGKDLDVELLREFEEFMKEPVVVVPEAKAETPKELVSMEVEDFNLDSEEIAPVKKPVVSKTIPKPSSLTTVSKPKKIVTRKLASSAQAKPKAKKTRLIDPALKKEMDLLSVKIDDVEKEYQNQTIEEKKESLSRPIQYETYTRIRKIPLSDIRGADDILKHDDEIIEIKFTNLMDKEL